MVWHARSPAVLCGGRSRSSRRPPHVPRVDRPKSPTKTTGFFRVATDRRATWDLAEGTARARGADGAPQRAGWAESKALALWWRRQTPTSSAWRRGGREPTARFSTPETHGTGRSRRSAQRAPGILRWQGAPPSPCRLRAGTAAFESVFSSVFSALRSLLGPPPGTRTFVYVPSFSRSTAAGYPTWAASVVLRLWVWGKPTPRPHSVR